MSKNHAKSLAKRGRWRSKNRANPAQHKPCQARARAPRAPPCTGTPLTSEMEYWNGMEWNGSMEWKKNKRGVEVQGGARGARARAWHGLCCAELARDLLGRSICRATLDFAESVLVRSAFRLHLWCFCGRFGA